MRIKNTNDSVWAVRGIAFQEPTSLHALVEHLDRMGAYAVGIGQANAAAALAAKELIEEYADALGIDLEDAEVYPFEYHEDVRG